MSRIRAELLRAIGNGTLARVAINHSYGPNADEVEIAAVLCELHNSGAVDVLSEFSLSKQKNSSRDVFELMQVLERVLPKLTGETIAVMECVKELTAAAGHDLAAGTLIDPFVEFCSKEIAYAIQAISIIDERPESYGSLLAAALIALGKLDLEVAVDAAIERATSSNENVSKRALWALGTFDYGTNTVCLIKAIRCLESLAQTAKNETILGAVTRATCRIVHKTGINPDDVIPFLEIAFYNGKEQSLHALADSLRFGEYGESPVFLCFILWCLKDANPKNKGTIESIGLGLGRLIRNNQYQTALDLLAYLLESNSTAISLGDLGHLDYEISRNQMALRYMATSFLASGRVSLGEAVAELVTEQASEIAKTRFYVDETIIEGRGDRFVLFLARKAVGYLLMRPKLCADFIVSAAEHINDEEKLKELSELLFWPLLLNYVGVLRPHLQNIIGEVADNSKKAIESALRRLKDYLECIESVGEIKELQSPQSHVDALARKRYEQGRLVSKLAKERSIFARLIRNSTLLYGRASIYSRTERDGTKIRLVTPMAAVEASVPFPQQHIIDPFGLDYTIRRFRVERLSE